MVMISIGLRTCGIKVNVNTHHLGSFLLRVCYISHLFVEEPGPDFGFAGMSKFLQVGVCTATNRRLHPFYSKVKAVKITQNFRWP